MVGRRSQRGRQISRGGCLGGTSLSFGTSGSTLSSYLAYAGYASKVFHPNAMAFIIIGNDFDESLLK